MKLKIRSRLFLGDTALLFREDEDTGCVGLLIIPKALAGMMAKRRETLAGEREFVSQAIAPRAWNLDSLVQVRARGDTLAGAFSAGRSLRGSSFMEAFRWRDQEINRRRKVVEIRTTLTHPRGYICEHLISWARRESGLRFQTRLCNKSKRPLTVEMISSFSLGGLTPFATDDASGHLTLHRFRSAWSAEGRLESIPLEALHLERSWAGYGVISERFGQVGSMPTRGFFPFVALEDTKAGVIWGAQLVCEGSWQMEAWRRGDTVALSGGWADRELGHWFKTLEPGETLETPVAHVAVGAESLDTFCQRLTGMQEAPLDKAPSIEKELPIVCNEYCTTWGKPSAETLRPLLRRLTGTPVRYVVIDAGWYAPPKGSWSSAHGDWVPNPTLFPGGLKKAAGEIRAAGFIPGLWFEAETVGKDATSFSLIDHLLKLDGEVISAGERRFWDMTDPWVVNYLTKHVIDLLKKAGFGYVKIDYNETLGIGCDGAESPGEGLVRQTRATHAFFRRMREAIPDLVIENCSSGGHRLEPSMLALSSMSSFSDAHETAEIPLIAAGLHRLILPRQSQIWAVLRKSDSIRRIVYSLAATFLGRMCLSGDLPELEPAQWRKVEEAMDLYGRCAPVIRHGTTQLFRKEPLSFRHPQGTQVMLRIERSGLRALVVMHALGKPVAAQVAVDLPSGPWIVDGMLKDSGASVKLAKGRLLWKSGGEMAGCVVLLKRARKKA